MKESGDGALKMGELSKKVKERRLRWYWHVMVGDGNRSTRKEKRGRP